MSESISLEDYLKEIYKLEEKSEDPIQTQAIAEKLNISPAAVSGMYKSLEQKGYIKREPYRGVTLTASGKKIGQSMLRKHRIVELFLKETLGLKLEEVHDEAERLEHAISEKVLEKLDKFLGSPKTDPHGEPIPDADGKSQKIEKIHILSTITEPLKGYVVRLNDLEESFMDVMKSVGIKVGSEIEVIKYNPFDYSIRVKIDNKKTETVSQKVAQYIWIKV